MPNTVLSREDCVYTKCYCEENVWHLCKRNLSESRGETFAVFISNPSRSVVIFRQQAGDPDCDGVVVWDYHVILVNVDAEGNALVFDLDSTLPFPVSLNNYVSEALGKEERLRPEFRRLFRVVKAETFVATFASDRSHMQKKDGSWSSPPPVYDPICTKESSNNIQDFINMSPKAGYGIVLNQSQFEDYFQTANIRK
jgi:hypothetical protein